jgi:hypothetical protein
MPYGSRATTLQLLINGQIFIREPQNAYQPITTVLRAHSDCMSQKENMFHLLHAFVTQTKHPQQ